MRLPRTNVDEMRCTNSVVILLCLVVTYCQVHQFPCVLYVCYAELSCVRSETMKSFRQLMSTSSFKGFVLVRLSNCVPLVKWLPDYSLLILICLTGFRA